jgi:predicted acylesterase/phospholipase RssA
MPAHIQIVSVAGTSAGAIVAAFVAKGYRGEQLKRILADPSLTKLLSEADVARWQRAERSWKAASPLFEKLLKEGTSFGTLWKLKGWAQQHAQSLRDLAEIWEERGIYKTERLRAWLDDHLGDLTFAQVEPLGHVPADRRIRCQWPPVPCLRRDGVRRQHPCRQSRSCVGQHPAVLHPAG